ncbi:hypothetical protein J1614_009320 [Plenodomus biglobosus]|nr:hypothetical protein J1614_009320 [Plenodomus biglobosus]
MHRGGKVLKWWVGVVILPLRASWMLPVADPRCAFHMRADEDADRYPKTTCYSKCCSSWVLREDCRFIPGNFLVSLPWSLMLFRSHPIPNPKSMVPTSFPRIVIGAPAMILGNSMCVAANAEMASYVWPPSSLCILLFRRHPWLAGVLRPFIPIKVKVCHQVRISSSSLCLMSRRPALTGNVDCGSSYVIGRPGIKAIRVPELRHWISICYIMGLQDSETVHWSPNHEACSTKERCLELAQYQVGKLHGNTTSDLAPSSSTQVLSECLRFPPNNLFA